MGILLWVFPKWATFMNGIANRANPIRCDGPYRTDNASRTHVGLVPYMASVTSARCPESQ